MASAADVQTPGGTGKASGKSTQRLLYSAVVVDCFVNPAAMTDAQKAKLKKGGYKVADANFVDRLPRNTISAIIVSDSASKSNATPILCYPFFSPHLCLPLKPGEKVFVMFEKGPGSQGYWLTRKSSDIDVDDLNYTHDDRTSQRSMLTSTTNIPTTSTISPSDAPTFPNGDETSPSKRALPGADDYSKIVTLATATAEFTGEPVPRYSRQSPDLILQGSNNTLISMGEELIVDSADAASLPTVDTELKQKGAIDIVTGRNTTYSDGAYAIVTDSSAETGTVSTTNDRDYDEVHKRAILDGTPYPSEGVVNFDTDLSRVYLTMQSTEGDARFGSNDIEALGDITIADEVDAPFAVVKSTHPRIIARSDGSMKIFHQSCSNLVLDNDVYFQISCKAGETICIGDAEANTQSSAITGAVTGLDQAVRGQDLVTLLNALSNAIYTFASTVSSGGQTPGYGAPNPTLASAGVALMAEVLATSIASVGEYSEVLSDTVFIGKG